MTDPFPKNMSLVKLPNTSYGFVLDLLIEISSEISRKKIIYCHQNDAIFLFYRSIYLLIFVNTASDTPLSDSQSDQSHSINRKYNHRKKQLAGGKYSHANKSLDSAQTVPSLITFTILVCRYMFCPFTVIGENVNFAGLIREIARRTEQGVCRPLRGSTPSEIIDLATLGFVRNRLQTVFFVFLGQFLM